MLLETDGGLLRVSVKCSSTHVSCCTSEGRCRMGGGDHMTEDVFVCFDVTSGFLMVFVTLQLSTGPDVGP